MTIKTVVSDGEGGGRKLGILRPLGTNSTELDRPAGPVVYTTPYIDILSAGGLFFNPVYGIELNQDAGFSGTPDGVHDGTDSALWTASAVSGTWTFDSTDEANGGTKSIDGTATVNNSEALLTRGSTISTGSYVALTGFVFLTGWVESKSGLFLQLQNGGVSVGLPIDVGDFVNAGLLGAWQKFSIPITDFAAGTATIDEISILVTGAGVNTPNFYLDDIQFEETGGALVFSLLVPQAGDVFKMREISFSMADAHQTYITGTSHPNIPYDQFLGVTLTNGIALRKVGADGSINAGLFLNHLDLAGSPDMRIEYGGDGTNSWITYATEFKEPVVLDRAKDDSLELVISDDLSGLLYFRVFARGTMEITPKLDK